jgi:hypothetical protein
MDKHDNDVSETKTPAQKLAELVARRKADLAGKDWNGSVGGRRASERAAAARSASRSKPAMKKA